MSYIFYITMNLSRYFEPNRWPKSGPLALNGVLLVAQKWPVGKQGVKVACIAEILKSRALMFVLIVISNKFSM